MTANVCTVCQLGRLESLDSQFVRAGIDVVGIQESRTQGDTDRLGDNFRMIAASAKSNGTCGD